MKLEFRVDARSIQKAVGDLLQKIDQPRPLLKLIGDLVVADIKYRLISSKADLVDKPWAPWKPGTRKVREKKGTAHLGLLYDSGNLLDSIRAQIVGSHNTLQVGTNVPYAKFLNDGTPKMAARPFMGISAPAKEAITTMVHKYFGSTQY
jgi:phage gpG-like protein